MTPSSNLFYCWVSGYNQHVLTGPAPWKKVNKVRQRSHPRRFSIRSLQTALGVSYRCLWTAKGRVVEEHVSVGLGEPFHRLNCNLRATYLLILVSMTLRAKNLSCQHCTLSCVRWIWKKLNGLGQIFFHRRIELQFLKNHEYLVALFVTENYHYQFYNLLQNKLTHALPHRQFWRC